MKKQLLNILLAFVMVIGIIPVNAIAEDSGSGSSQTENNGEFIDGEHVISDMIEKNGMYAHPRIIMSEEKFAKLKTSIGDDSVTGILLEKLQGEADRILDQPVCQYEIPGRCTNETVINKKIINVSIKTKAFRIISETPSAIKSLILFHVTL